MTPTKKDFITQVEGDLATREGDAEATAVLQERLEAVNAASDDKAAFEAYHGHVKATREDDEKPNV
jgi:hypothetical protein